MNLSQTEAETDSIRLRNDANGQILRLLQGLAGNAAHGVVLHAGITVQAYKYGACVTAFQFLQDIGCFQTPLFRLKLAPIVKSLRRHPAGP